MKVYLATKSEARKRLFRLFGLRFKVIRVKVRENKQARGVSYAELVKRNALLKAQAAASKVNSGIILAADTIMVQGGRIFGKPKDLKQAKRTLKRLSRSAQLVYTGVALIDQDHGRTILDYEKSTVYMDKLSDSDINRYFSRTSPLDKAGSYDIQGKGAFFVRRIEGCFYNIVGLPLRKVYLMFKKLKVRVPFVFLFFLFFSAISLAGCSSEYNIVTGKEERYYYSTDREVSLGEAVARQVEEEFKPDEDLVLQKRLEDIGKKIAAVCDRKDIDYHFKVLDNEEVNAFALPGGYIYVNKGLIERVANDDELAGVLGHEIGHVVARHSIKKLQALQGYTLLRVLLSQVPQGAEAGAAADLAFSEILLGYGREDELLADRLGARYLRLAGYDPAAMISFLEKLQEINRRKPLKPCSYLRTHPFVTDRIRVVKQELGEKINFKDYINIEDGKPD